MNDTPASGERVQKYVFDFEIYRFAKKAAKLPHPPLPDFAEGLDSNDRATRLRLSVIMTSPFVCPWTRPSSSVPVSGGE